MKKCMLNWCFLTSIWYIADYNFCYVQIHWNRFVKFDVSELFYILMGILRFIILKLNKPLHDVYHLSVYRQWNLDFWPVSIRAVCFCSIDDSSVSLVFFFFFVLFSCTKLYENKVLLCLYVKSMRKVMKVSFAWSMCTMRSSKIGLDSIDTLTFFFFVQNFVSFFSLCSKNWIFVCHFHYY